MYDPRDTQLIFVRSEKDRDQQPQPGTVKRDGSASYLQPYKRNGLEPMSKHGYMAYLPTVQFGPGMTSATEIRAKWPGMTPEQKTALVRQLYPDTQAKEPLVGVIVKIFDQVMGGAVEETLKGPPVGSGAQDLQPQGTPMPNGPDQVKTGVRMDQEFDEAIVVSDPDSGVLVRPEGGMGTWNEDTLVSDLARKFSNILGKLKGRDYQGIHTMLYRDRWISSLVRALAELEVFQQRQGSRPIAAGREVDTSDYIEEKNNNIQ